MCQKHQYTFTLLSEGIWIKSSQTQQYLIIPTLCQKVFHNSRENYETDLTLTKLQETYLKRWEI